MGDHVAFDEYGYPALAINQGGWPTNIHRSTDLMGTLDRENMIKVIQVGTASLALLATEETTGASEEMTSNARSYLRSTQHRPDIVKAYFQEEHVRYTDAPEEPHHTPG